MQLTFQHNQNDYTIDIKQPLFGGDLKLGDIITVKTLDTQYFELCIVNVEGEIYECEVLDTYANL